jgi:hypothetical protein
MTSKVERSWSTPIMLCIAGPLWGAVLGIITNAIDGAVCSDYFAIVMSWDGQSAAYRALFQSAIEGFALGLFFGFFLAVATAASTRLRCPRSLAMRALCLALAIVLICWSAGGVIGFVLAKIWPKLWGFFFIGVPPRVNLPRFAWVGGSIWGAHGGTLLGLIVCSVFIHIRWRRLNVPLAAFPVLMHSPDPRVQ